MRHANHGPLLTALVTGIVIGALAKLIMPGKDPGGIIVTMLLGIAGSLVASFLGIATTPSRGCKARSMRPRCSM